MDKKVFLLDKEHYTKEDVATLTEKDLENYVSEEDYTENYTIIKIDANFYNNAEDAIKEEFPILNIEDYFIVSFGF